MKIKEARRIEYGIQWDCNLNGCEVECEFDLKTIPVDIEYLKEKYFTIEPGQTIDYAGHKGIITYRYVTEWLTS